MSKKNKGTFDEYLKLRRVQAKRQHNKNIKPLPKSFIKLDLQVLTDMTKTEIFKINYFHKIIFKLINKSQLYHLQCIITKLMNAKFFDILFKNLNNEDDFLVEDCIYILEIITLYQPKYKNTFSSNNNLINILKQISVSKRDIDTREDALNLIKILNT